MTRSRRRTALFVVVAVLLLFALYAAAWQAMADRWRGGIARWTEAQAAKGWTVTTGAVTVSGFPGAIRLALPAPRAADTAGNGWEGPPVTIHVSPFAPLDPGVEAPGTHRFTLAGHAPLEIAAGTLTGQLAVEGGAPAALAVTATRLAGAGVTANRIAIDLRRPVPAPGQAVPTILTATLEIDTLALPAEPRLPLDQTLAAAHLAARLKGAIPRGAPRDALAAWRDAGGTMEIDSIDFDWPPVSGAGNATLALDANLQPEMAGSLTMRGLPAAIDRAGAAGTIKPAAAIVAKLALGLAAKPASDGTPETKVAVTIQNRVLSVGPIPLMQLPEVKW